ncbi:MAG: hypothetical protein V1846_03770 [Candidatus Komeilibacteria bacterium]
MKRIWYVLFTLVLAGCGVDHGPITPPVKLASTPDSQALQLKWQAVGYADSLSPLLGWPDYAGSTAVSLPDDYQALLVPLEAEDELRFLIGIFQDGKLTAATALGLSPTNWFSTVRAETLTTYEGWLFFYDLHTGQRCLNRYYEADQLLEHSEYLPMSPLSFDLLGRQASFEWLELETMRPPGQLTPRIFLQTEIEPVVTMITPQLTLLVQSLRI